MFPIIYALSIVVVLNFFKHHTNLVGDQFCWKPIEGIKVKHFFNPWTLAETQILQVCALVSSTS